MLGKIFKVSPFIFIVYLINLILDVGMGAILNVLTTLYLINAIQFGGELRQVVFTALILLVLKVIWKGYKTLFDERIWKKNEYAISKQLHQEIFEKASRLDLACYDNPDFYNQFILAVADLDSRVKSFLGTFSSFITGIASIVGYASMFILLDPVGLIFVAISFILSLFLNQKLSIFRYKGVNALKKLQRKREYSARVFYLGDFAKEIRLSNVRKPLMKQYDEATDDIIKTGTKYAKKTGILEFLDNFCLRTFMIDGLYVAFLAYRAVSFNAFSYAAIFTLWMSLTQLVYFLSLIAKQIGQFVEYSAYIENYRHLMAYENKVINDAEPLMPPDNSPAIDVKGVNFQYEGTDHLTLHDLNITIKAGQRVAIVGHNGAGKTTLVKLLMRMYDPNDGVIQFNKTDIRKFDLEKFQKSFGVVFQDFKLFAATIAENVVMNEYENNFEPDVRSALFKSGFEVKLNKLEKDISTPLTKEFSADGINLSGGEAQKIALARMFYKNSPIVILDEPSSALDPIAEYELNKTMLSAAVGKTVIVISHRLSTTRFVDKIFMLEKGTVVEEGSHDELMQKNGKYAYMYSLQAKKYNIKD